MGYEENTKFIKKMFKQIKTDNSGNNSINPFDNDSRIQTSHASSARANNARRHYSFDHNAQHLLRPNYCVASVNEETSVGQKKILTKDNFESLITALAQNDPTIVALTVEFRLTEREMDMLYRSISNNTELGYISWQEVPGSSHTLRQIEIKLVGNNKNYKYYPNDYVHALLSKHAYKNSEHGGLVTLDPHNDTSLKNWHVEKVYDDTQVSGYYGAIYINHKTHQVVLAIRGTEEIIASLFRRNSDWQTNIEEILGDQIVVGQQARNLQATAEAIDIAKNHKYRLSFTGHSLGAWLAELCGFYSHAYFGYPNIKVVTFDSPGTAPMMEKLKSNIESTYTQVDLRDIDIVSYLASPNPANCCNRHVGKIYRIAPKMEWTGWVNNTAPNFVQNAIGNDKIQGILAIEGHSLTGILETFDPQTSKPREYRRMADWPRMEYIGDKRPFSNRGMTVMEYVKESIRNSTVSHMIKRALGFALDKIPQDGTAMTIIGFLKSYVNGEIYQEQYWTYFKNIRFEENAEDTPEIRTKLKFNNQFALITQTKYREIGDIYTLKPIKGSVDEYLYELYKNRENLAQHKHISEIIKNQLEDLLSTFSINQISDGQYCLVPNMGYDVESIRQRMQRLLHTSPRNMLDMLQNITVHTTKNIINLGLDAEIVIPKLSENIPSEVAYYTEIHGKKEELDSKLAERNVVVIKGLAGMGKSTLAAKYGSDCKEKNGFQVLWIKGMQIEEYFFQLAKDLKLKVEKQEYEGIKATVYAYLERLIEKQQILLIFDNVEEEEKIIPYLRDLPNRAKVIITSKNSNLLSGVYPMVELEGFNKEEAKSFIKKALPHKNEENIEKLIATVGLLPFRLFEAVTYFKKNSLKSVDDFIREFKLHPATQLLFKDLNNEDSRELLKYLTYLDTNGASLTLIQNITGKTADQLQEAVCRLQELSMMQVIEGEGNKKILKVKHGILKDEMKKLLLEEDRAQIPKILQKLMHELNKALPKSLLHIAQTGSNFQNINIEEVSELVSHAKVLAKEAKEAKLSIVGREQLLYKIGLYHHKIVLNHQEAIYYWEELLNYQRQIYQGDHAIVASALILVGFGYRESQGAENIRKGLKFSEDGLRMYQKLFSSDHPDVARALNMTGRVYLAFGDADKALEYMKQACSAYLATSNYDATKTITPTIELLQPDFKKYEPIKRFENRLIILSRGEISDNLIAVKQKIQRIDLNEIVKASSQAKWTAIDIFGWDWGVKGYLNQDYLKGQLQELGNNKENIESAQMLCFESMNLGIMKCEKKPYEVVEAFTQANPVLVKKIAEQHPEFFVDGSIVMACIRAMPHDKSFEEHILKHVKYVNKNIELKQSKL